MSSETDQESQSAATQGQTQTTQTSSRRPIMVVRIRGIAFKAAWGSKRAYILQELASQETQVDVPWALALFAGACLGAALTAIIDYFL